MSNKVNAASSTAKPKKKDLSASIIHFLTENNDKQFNYKQIGAAVEPK